jgi:hypothetical protein
LTPPSIYPVSDKFRRLAPFQLEWQVEPKLISLKEAARRYGISERSLRDKEMGYHALRHQKANELADRGESLPYIRDFLGCEDISTISLYLQSLGIKE